MYIAPYAFLLIGFVFLIKGADFLVDGASSIARQFNISDLVIGLTIVAFGTSTPELFVNILASLKGNTDIAVGNILGSNIANILLILGVSSAIYPLTVTKGTVWKEIPLSLLAALVLGFMANDQLIDKRDISVLTRIDGLILLSFFAIFIYYSASIAKRTEGMNDHISMEIYGFKKSVFLITLGFIGLTLGGKWIVDGAVHMSKSLGMSESLVGLTVVAIGTSLPELATSAMAAYKKNVDIAVGNVVGSNIFNIFFVLGISSIINPIPFLTKNNADIGAVLVSSLLLFALTGRNNRLDRWKGVVFIGLYVAYNVFIIIRN
ncbi:MAG: calcium/sodium antiporter [Syntrophales bacterium]